MQLHRLFLLGFLLLLVPRVSAQATLLEVSGPSSHSFGRICDLLGDVDGDGRGDFLVAAPRASNGSLRDAGSLFVYSGADGSLLRQFQGAREGDFLGFYSSAAGDVDGDALGDLLVAAYRENVPGVGVNAGAVDVVAGPTGLTLRTFLGPAAQARMGSFTASLADQDGDGRPDLLVTGGGLAHVFSGRDGSLLRQFPTFALAWAVARDVDGDGLADLAELRERPGPSAGMFVRVVSGVDGAELWQREAGLADASLAFVGDLDGDGLDELALGAPHVASGTGRVRLHSGRDGTLLREHLGDHPQDRLGAAVTGAGDLDGDGVGDLAVGMTGFDGAAGLDCGAVRAFSGRTGASLGTIEGGDAGGQLGARLAGGRDVNGDGVPEVIASAIPDAASLAPVARVRVLSFVPRGLEPFGTGSPGCLGSSTLLANGVPTLGAAGFELHAANVGAFPLLLVGDTEDTLGTLFHRARFHLALNPPPPAQGILLQRPLPAPDASGSLVAPFPIPNDPALLGRTFVLQVASLFRGSCGQDLATSRGLRLTVQ